MDSADSDRRNATVPATDFKLVGDFSDVRLKILDFCSGVSDALIDVSINPATTAFERIPFPPHSLAIFLEKASIAPLVEAYMDNPLYPVCTLIEEMCTMEPFAWCNIKFLIAYFVIIMGANTFTLYIFSNRGICIFVAMSSYAIAALLTYPCMGVFSPINSLNTHFNIPSVSDRSYSRNFSLSGKSRASSLASSDKVRLIP